MDCKFLLSFVPGILAAAAFLTTLFGGIYCRFLSFTSFEDVNGEPLTVYFGIWYYLGWVVVDSTDGYAVMQTCWQYPEGTVFDAKWKSAKAFSTMAIILGGIVTCWALCAGCLYPSKKMYVVASMLYMLTCLFTGLSLLILDSNACNNNVLLQLLESEAGLVDNVTFPDTCSSAYGAKCIFSATVLWFVAAVGLLLVAPPKRDRVTTEAAREVVKAEEDIKASEEPVAEENVDPTPMEGQQQEA